MTDNWEDYYEANRAHIDDLVERFTGRSDKVQSMSNKQVAKGLYKLILTGDRDDLLLAEAAERLGVAEITETQNERKN